MAAEGPRDQAALRRELQQERYNYRKPRRINWVSALLVVAGLAVAYGAWKFGPVFYRNYKVDEVLTDIGYQSSDVRFLTNSKEASAAKLVDSARRRIQKVGIDDPYLRVYFDPGYDRVIAEYTVIVDHPIGKPTTMKVRRSARVPNARIQD